MKRFIFSLFVCGLFYSFEASAQRKQFSEFYSPPTEFPVNLDGKMVYYCVPDENGKYKKDGPLSIKGGLTNHTVSNGYERLVINSSYNLNANLLKGSLNGALTMNLSFNARFRGETKTGSASLRGNFKDGDPNGNFVANYNCLSVKAKMNVNYKRGILVGPYMVNYVDDESLYESIKGTLTPDGELTGNWSFDSKFDAHTAVFHKGVRLSRSDKKSVTPSVLVEKARQFANGILTEDALFEQGISVVEDSIDLREYPNNIMFYTSIIKLEDLGNYDFSKSNMKKFKYLRKTYSLTDQGFNVLLATIKKVIKEGYEYTSDFVGLNTSATDPCDIFVATDEKGFKYVKTNREDLTSENDYTKIRDENIYLTKEQSAVLQDKVEQMRKEAVCGLWEYLQIVYEEDYERNFANLRQKVQEEPTLRELSALYKNLFAVRLDTLKVAREADFLQFPTKTGIRYVKKTAINELNDYKTLLLDKIKECFATNPNITIDFNDEVLSKVNHLSKILPPLSFLLNKSAISIAYDDKVDKYFSARSLQESDYYRLELSKRIKKIVKITHIKVKGFDGDAVVCEFTKKGKEVYQTSIEIEDGRIIIASIDFNEAKLISE